MTRKRSKESILSLVNSFEEKHSVNYFCSEKCISTSTIYKYFDSWNEVLRKSKFKSVNQKRNYKNEEILQEIQDIEKQQNNNTVTYREFEEKSEISAETVLNRFGSWNEALKEAGVEIINRKNISEEELLNELKRLCNNYCVEKKGIKHKTVREHGDFSLNTFRRVFGSLNNALEKVNFPETDGKQVEKDFLLSDIQRVSREYCNGNRPSIEDIDDYGAYSPPTYIEKFGSWNNAVEQSGFEKYEHPTGEENPTWKGGYEDYYGQSWRQQRRNALKRDNYECVVCGKKKSTGKTTPDVHHIKPKRKWNVEEEHEQMNELSNLICLCPFHHRQLEGRWQDLNHREYLDKIDREYRDD